MSLTFIGHTTDRKEISPDPQKIAAINQMASSKLSTNLRCFMGMVNQLGKFFPWVAKLSKPMRELLILELGNSSRRSISQVESGTNSTHSFDFA